MRLRIRRESFDLFTKSIYALNNEGVLRISEENLSIILTDSAKVAMLIANIGPTGYDLFPEEGESDLGATEVRLGYDARKASTYVPTLMTDVELRFYYGEDMIAKGKLGISSKDETFNVGLLALDAIPSEPQNVIHKIEHTAYCTVKGSELSAAMKRAGSVAEKVLFRIDPVKKAVSIFSEDIDDYTKNFFEAEDIGGTEPALTLVSVDYILDILKVMSKMDKIKISGKTDFPLKLEANYADFDLNVTYLLAPRIENRDD